MLSFFYSVNFEEALAYKNRRRNQPPGVYNPKMLRAKGKKGCACGLQSLSKFLKGQSSGNLNETHVVFVILILRSEKTDNL